MSVKQLSTVSTVSPSDDIWFPVQVNGEWLWKRISKDDLFDVTVTTGTVISFAASSIYGTHSAPETGNLTDNLTGAKLGVIQKIYHNSGTSPTVPAGWVRLGSQTYTTSTLNIIYCEWVGGTRVEYWITQ